MVKFLQCTVSLFLEKSALLFLIECFLYTNLCVVLIKRKYTLGLPQSYITLWCINTHHNGTTVNWLPCAQVSKDNGPAIMVTTTEKIGGA